MDDNADHYEVLGLPFGEDGAKLTEKEISKALELHPDKRPDDPHAHANFQRLKCSYEILKDEKARKLFDDLLRVKREQQRWQSEQDGKKRKMVSDLEERERAFDPDPAARHRDEEARIARKLKEEIERIRAMHANKGAAAALDSKASIGRVNNDSSASAGPGLDKERVLKVSWEKIAEDYTAEMLRDIFLQFDEVEDVVIKASRKRGSAIIVMATKDAAVA